MSPFFRSRTRSGALVLVLVCLLAFRSDDVFRKLALDTQLTLNTFHAAEPPALKIKKCEISISDEGFLRYRKFYVSGKQEYYSFNLSRLRSVDYLGNTASGNLIIQTLEDDVIVQTYNDRAGNVDSMSVELTMMINAINAEDLVKLQQDMFEMKRLLRLKGER